MNRRYLVATFESESDILSATAEVRRNGFRIVEVFTPYPVHGMDRAMGFRPSFLTWVCFACGMIGAVGTLVFQHWSNAVDWPIDVGGKPWNSWPAEVPVGFAMMVLLAGFGTVFAFLAACRLFPGAKAKCLVPGVTDDRFALVVEEEEAPADGQRFAAMLDQYNVVNVEQMADEEAVG